MCTSLRFTLCGECFVHQPVSLGLEQHPKESLAIPILPVQSEDLQHRWLEVPAALSLLVSHSVASGRVAPWSHGFLLWRSTAPGSVSFGHLLWDLVRTKPSALFLAVVSGCELLPGAWGGFTCAFCVCPQFCSFIMCDCWLGSPCTLKEELGTAPALWEQHGFALRPGWASQPCRS